LEKWTSFKRFGVLKMAHEDVSTRRREILEAAMKVFEVSGYAATTVDAVAEEAGVSKGSIYNYFPSKHELFQQIFADAMTSAEGESMAILSEPISATVTLEKLLDHWFSRLSYHKRIGRLVLEFWATAAREQQGQLAVTFAKAYAQWRERLAGILARGIEAGEFRSELQTSVAASLVMAILDGIEVQTILDVGIRVDEEFLAALKRAILIALSARDGSAPTR
jgi:AcrR family transcriptional regulator